MYGMVNQAIKDLVTSKFGQEAWNKMCEEVSIPTADFVFMDYYPDKITYDLVGAAANLLAISPGAVLEEFGKHWVLFTAREGYGAMMDLFGADFKDCLMNLNNLHARMGMTMPNLTPPRFVFKEVSPKKFEVEYQSKRPGLCPMVRGLLLGLAAKYNCNAEIEFSEVEGKKIFDISIIDSK